MRRDQKDPRFLAAAWILIILFVVSIASALAAVMNGSDGVVRPKEGGEGVWIQRSSNGCGVAALMMGMEQLGVHEDPEILEQELAPAPDGVSMRAMRECARRRGIAAEGWRLMPEELERVSTPAILFVGGNHFVLFDSLGSDRRAFLRDPAVGRKIVGLRDLEKIWKGETLVLMRTPANTDSLKHRTK